MTSLLYGRKIKYVPVARTSSLVYIKKKKPKTKSVSSFKKQRKKGNILI